MNELPAVKPDFPVFTISQIQLYGAVLQRMLNGTAFTDGCWIWGGHQSDSGYGLVGHEGSQYRIHRLSHTIFVGPIPDGHHVDHVRDRGCTSRLCWKPDHLEAVTQQENNRRAVGSGWPAEAARRGVLASAAKKRAATHCKRGHEYTEKNTYWLNAEKTQRRCNDCAAITQRDYVNRKKSAK